MIYTKTVMQTFCLFNFRLVIKLINLLYFIINATHSHLETSYLLAKNLVTCCHAQNSYLQFELFICCPWMLICKIISLWQSLWASYIIAIHINKGNTDNNNIFTREAYQSQIYCCTPLSLNLQIVANYTAWQTWDITTYMDHTRSFVKWLHKYNMRLAHYAYYILWAMIICFDWWLKSGFYKRNGGHLIYWQRAGDYQFN